MKELILVFGFYFILFLFFFLIMLAVYHFFYGTTVKEGIEMFKDDFKKFSAEMALWAGRFFKLCLKIAAYFGYEPPAVSYPVYIGMDESGMFHPEIIEHELCIVLEEFESSYFKGTAYSESGNIIIYTFSASYFKEDIPDSVQQLEYLTKKADAAVHRYIYKKNPAFTSVPNLVTATCSSNELSINIALNPAGTCENAGNWALLRQKLLASPSEHMEITEHWNEYRRQQMAWGYNHKIILETGQHINISLPVETHPHALITGSSGSGKSYALCYLLGELVKTEENITVYFCDYKKSDDFSFLDKYPYYYAGDDCYRGIMDYYSRFQDARESGSSGGRFCLIVDEYPAFVSRLQMSDKVNKTKRADEILSAVSELLMLGRGTGGGFGVWIVTQRPDASLFKGGSRDSFMITLAVGRLSREHKGMIFPGFSDEIPDRNFQRGEGLLLADGHGLTQVKFPLIDDIDGWKRHILENL